MSASDESDRPIFKRFGAAAHAAVFGGGPASWAVGFAVALLAVLAFWNGGGTYRTGASKGTGAMLVIAIGAIGFAGWSLVRKRRASLPWPPALLGLAWGHVVLVSALAGATYWGGYQMAKTGGLFALMVLVVNTFDTRKVGRLARPLACLMLLLAGSAVAANLVGFKAYHYGVGVPLYLSAGNPNVLGGFLVLVLPLTLGGFMLETDRRWKRVIAAAAVAVVAMILASQSRNAAATMVVGVGLFALLWARYARRRSWARSLAAPAAVALLALVVVFAAMPGDIGRNVSAAFTGRSAQGRAFFYAAAFDMVTDRPAHLLFGQGSGRFRERALAVPSRDYGLVVGTKNTLFIHNEYLELWFEGGLVALGLFLAAMGWTLWRIRRRIARPGDDDPSPPTSRPRAHGDNNNAGAHAHADARRQRGWLIACGVSLVMFMLFGLISVGARYSDMQFLFALLLAATWAILRDADPASIAAPDNGDRAPADAPRQAGSAAGPAIAAKLLPAACAVIAAGSLGVATLYFQSERTLRAAKEMAFRADPPEFESARRRFRSVSALGLPSPEALYDVVNVNFALDAPIDTARSDFERSQALIPWYKDVGMVFARHLFHLGRPADAIDVVRGHLDAHPFHFRAHLDHCVYPLALGDQAALETAMARFLRDAVSYLNLLDRAELTYHEAPAQPGRLITIHAPDTGATAKITYRRLPGYLFGGKMPGDDREARRLVAANARKLFTGLGVEDADFLPDPPAGPAAAAPRAGGGLD